MEQRAEKEVYPAGVLSRVHINQHRYFAAKLRGSRAPFITVKHGSRNWYTRCIQVLSASERPALTLRESDGALIEIAVEAPLFFTNDDGKEEWVECSPSLPGSLRVLGQAIALNRDKGLMLPVLHLRCGGFQWDGHRALLGRSDEPVAEFVYRPERPLSCGARLWVETRASLALEAPESFAASCSL